MSERVAEGTVIGDAYRVVRPLRAGGMGAVYVAEQLSTGKLRALKLMHDRLQADPKLRERFVKEARVASAIDSAHVVEVIGAGVEEETGTPWLAMELLDGQDLADHVKDRGPLSYADVLRLLEEICHAVGEAHDHGIVHRDLKPENIFVAKARAAGHATTVKILDFGIAKLVAEVKTMGTSAVGSPAWMAPEQAEAGETITPAADVWALGLIAFWMLTGVSYWRTASQANISMHAFLKEILFEALPVASQRARDLGVAVRLPAGFDDWLERAVHREPRARFRDARELLAAFRALGGDQPAAIAVASPTEKQRVESVPMSTRAFLSTSGIGDAPTQARASEEDVPAAPAKTAPEAAQTTESSPPAEPAPEKRAEVRVPESATLTPVLEATAVSRTSSNRPLVIFAGVAVAAVAVFAVVSVLMVRGKALPPPPPAMRAPDPEPIEAPLAVPVETVTQEPLPSSHSAAPHAPTKGAQHATPDDTATATASAEPPPFNRFAAESSVKTRASNAEFHCKGKFDDDVGSIALNFVYSPDGTLARIDVDPMQRHKPSVNCAINMVRHITIPPFAGTENQTITLVVTLQ